MKLTKRERTLLLGALIIAVAVMFVNYIYFPLKKDVKALSSQAEELSIQIDEARQKQALVKILEKQLSKLQKKEDTSYKDVLKTWDEPEILVYIEQTLGVLGFSNKIENYGAITGEGYLNGDINLSITATYENLQTILKKFEKGKYFNTVVSMEVAEKDDSVIDDSVRNAEKKQLDINLVLRFYALDFMKEYTKNYKFMKGQYGKTNIFE